MPVIKVDMWEGRDKDTKRELIQAITKAVSETLNVSAEQIHVIINEVPKDNWGIAGEQASRLD
ncbi:MAG: 2-hydroxymuconate tautomerase family protein [Archaeoglobaceae archaeon]|nr:2-hydroxymuconate tautomerase family protein [Archaeoglobaceae archaeon]